MVQESQRRPQIIFIKTWRCSLTQRSELGTCSTCLVRQLYRRPRFADCEGWDAGAMHVSAQQFTLASPRSHSGLTSHSSRGLGMLVSCVSRVWAGRPWPALACRRLRPAQLRAVHLPGTVCRVPAWPSVEIEDGTVAERGAASLPAAVRAAKRTWWWP